MHRRCSLTLGLTRLWALQVRELEQMLQESEDAEMEQMVQDERRTSLQLVGFDNGC